jgi:hypothetical protein
MSIAATARSFALCLTLGGLVFISGCAQPVGKVSGTVTLNQKPLPDADLLFESIANPSEQFMGTSGADGKYVLSYRGKSGMPPGAYHVLVTYHTVVGSKNPLPGGEQGAVIRNQGAGSKRSVSFEKDIVEGNNELSFEITSGTKVPNP